MNFVFKFIEKNKTKIFSLICGGLIWFLVVSENQYETVVSIPINPVNLKAGYVIANQIPNQVKVRFRGKGRALMALHMTRGARAIVDLARLEGRIIHEIRTKDIEIRKDYIGLEPISISLPDSFTVFIDELAEKSVPVVSDIKVNPAPGFAVVGGIQFSPAKIFLTGPASELNDISFVKTESMVFNNRFRDIREQVKLIPPANRNVKMNSLSTLTTVDIQKLLERTFTGIPLKIKNLPPKTRAIIIPSTLDITIDGGEDLIILVQKEEIEAYIDFSVKLDPNEHDYPAFIVTPPGVNYRKVQPIRFKVILEKNHFLN